MEKKIQIPNSVNPDIAIERKNASFDPEEMAIWYYGSKENLSMKRIIVKESCEDLDDPLLYEFLSYEDMASLAIKCAIDSIKNIRALQERFNPGGSEIYPARLGDNAINVLTPGGNPFTVHILMFTRALREQGTPEQYEKFGRRADNCEIIGTFAQTELGHGTYLKGLEARADYDRRTEEFVLNTPKLTSYKWWPGGLGQTSNYCIVVAQLYIDNEPKGIQMFVVQIRDEETHMPLPGVHVGEIGKKVGYNGVNHGFLGLRDYRVPRLNMLMRNQQVLADGTYVKSPVSQLSYYPMMFVRCMVARMCAEMLAQVATITTRFSVIRRQSPIDEGDGEPKILEHMTQQMKVIPEIATSIAYSLAAKNLRSLYDETSEAIMRQDFSRLPELHALACILKVSCSYDATYGIERLRQGCGGHGFLTAGNVGTIFSMASAACTYEGENSVLYLQVGKILMKAWADAMAGKQLMPTLMYIKDCSSGAESFKWKGTWQCLVKAIQYACVGSIRVAFASFNSRLKQGHSQSVAVSKTGQELTKAAELHGRAYVAANFHQEVMHGRNKEQRSPQFQRVLENLLELHLLQIFFRHLGDILRFVHISEDDIASLQTRLEEVLKKLRPDAVAITDGFDFEDKVLSSALGCYDGNVYERLFQAALKHPLNKKPVADFYELHLKPFMRENAAKAGANAKL
ncbi:probable peroxisomal acyl-coenzyme A oxidase 1 [Stomoxys calcitrans]|uniref:probable peroxisomal acyl-coenzyme A oxidase 1 n=1 Tax=Stomoxys calcitrans TaxID=35570 RepID=UPI0027E2E8AE|nr:probable peroxisomal acyl-coenzyme A oxidase 1 [Stomoxys calcitrans]